MRLHRIERPALPCRRFLWWTGCASSSAPSAACGWVAGTALKLRVVLICTIAAVRCTWVERLLPQAWRLPAATCRALLPLAGCCCCSVKLSGA